MAEWQSKELTIPDSLKPLVQGAGVGLGVAADVLDAGVAFSRVGLAGAEAGVDIYSILVKAIIDETQAVLNDFKNLGAYVLLDYPQSINAASLNPIAPANLGGTLVDPIALDLLTSDDDELKDATGDGSNKMQAIARRRNTWNPVSRDLISYRVAIERITAAFNDNEDPLRPEFSISSKTKGVVLMVWSEDAATFVKLVRSIVNIFAFDELDQIRFPALGDLLGGVTKALDEYSDSDLRSLDLTAPTEIRNGGRHPNFVLNTRIGDLIPILGSTLDLLSELVEQLRPNGNITEFVNDSLDFIEKKIERVRQLADELRALSEGMQAAFSGTKFAMVKIDSSTGDAGFRSALRNSTSHPQFDRALVASVVIYAGGPNLDGFDLLFGEVGKSIDSAIDQAIDDIDRHLDRPVLRP